MADPRTSYADSSDSAYHTDSADHTDSSLDHLFQNEHTTKDAVARVHNWISEHSSALFPEPSIRESSLIPQDYDHDAFLYPSPSCPNLRILAQPTIEEAQLEWERQLKSFSQLWQERPVTRVPHRREKPLPPPPRLDQDVGPCLDHEDPFASYPSSPASSTSTFTSSAFSSTHSPSRSPSERSLRKLRLSRSTSTSHFPSISKALSFDPSCLSPTPQPTPQPMRQRSYTQTYPSEQHTHNPKLHPVQHPTPLQFHSSFPSNDSSTTLTTTSPASPRDFSFPPSPSDSRSTLTTPTTAASTPTTTNSTLTSSLNDTSTANTSPSSSVSSSSRVRRHVPSALSLFHLPSRSNLKATSSPVASPSQSQISSPQPSPTFPTDDPFSPAPLHRAHHLSPSQSKSSLRFQHNGRAHAAAGSSSSSRWSYNSASDSDAPLLDDSPISPSTDNFPFGYPPTATTATVSVAPTPTAMRCSFTLGTPTICTATDTSFPCSISSPLAFPSTAVGATFPRHNSASSSNLASVLPVALPPKSVRSRIKSFHFPTLARPLMSFIGSGSSGRKEKKEGRKSGKEGKAGRFGTAGW